MPFLEGGQEEQIEERFVGLRVTVRAFWSGLPVKHASKARS